VKGLNITHNRQMDEKLTIEEQICSPNSVFQKKYHLAS